MARKKEEPQTPTSSPAKKKGTPSVTTFLSKISTPKSARPDGTTSSPAKDLLGGVTRADVDAVDRGDENALMGSASLALEQTEDLTVEITAEVDAGPDASPEVSDRPLRGATGAGARKLERLPWQGVVDVRGVFAGPVGKDALGEGPKANNVSAGGVFVETAHLLEVGDPVVLSFPGEGGARLVVSGRVRWVTPFGRVDDPTPGMGIEFVGLDKSKRDKINALLNRARSV